MASNAAPKTDIEAIFHRLRSLNSNKTCFDCNAKNPTWASVTYGVFICIDCSAVHRGLGVHLTFVRSTNLDTNWTWTQLRQMQLGGNANAGQFFRQHNCNTSDSNQKYNSRAAQLYRDKLQSASQQAMQLHGTKLHLDGTQEPVLATDIPKEEDFFADSVNDNHGFGNEASSRNDVMLSGGARQKFTDDVVKSAPVKENIKEEFSGPNVDFLNSTVPNDAHKSTIGVRKIQPKKSGMGGKKAGLGATKVKTNFADIEKRASMADQLKETVPEKSLSLADEAETMASVRLAYQDLSVKQHREEERLKAVDPAKAKQMERLGMGFNLRGGVSHSAITDMQTITQENAPKMSSKSYDREPSSNDFFDDYSTSMYSSPKVDRDRDLLSSFEVIQSHSTQNIQTMFTPTNTAKKSISDQPSYSRHTTRKSEASNASQADSGTSAQTKFGGAKAISSDQFFGEKQQTHDSSASLNRFQGSNSISSSDYFSDGTTNGSSRAMNTLDYGAANLIDVKESVRQGVTKVAGRLSSIATDVMSSIQDKYGGY